jgi:hypothetical protein
MTDLVSATLAHKSSLPPSVLKVIQRRRLAREHAKLAQPAKPTKPARRRVLPPEETIAPVKAGMRFGAIKVDSCDAADGQEVFCTCQCGAAVVASARSLLNGETLSCGCAPGSETECIVYGILAGSHIKIGISSRFKHRLHAIQTGVPMDVEILCLLNKGSRSVEKAIHALLKPYHSHGEWFSAEPFLLDSFAHSTDADDLIRRVQRVVHKGAGK